MMAEQLSQTTASALASAIRLARVVGLVFLTIVILLIVVARLVPAGPVNVEGSEAAALIRPIYIGEMVAGFLVIIVRRLILSSWIIGHSRRKGAGAVLRLLLSLSLFGGAVAVTMGLTGLLVCWMTGEFHHVLRLGGIGLLLALYSLPRQGEWRQALADL